MIPVSRSQDRPAEPSLITPPDRGAAAVGAGGGAGSRGASGAPMSGGVAAGPQLARIAGAIRDRSARGVATAISRLINTGEFPAGTRLPTVRSVARQLGISPTTVSEAWRSLARAGAIQTRGRSGTFVCTSDDRPRLHLRYAQLSASPATLPCDLSTGIPDHALLPDIAPALSRVGGAQLTTSYLDAPVLPELAAVLRKRWPYPPEQLTVVDGALDALDRITSTAVRFGDHVLVEDPAFPPMLDLLESVGAQVTGVPLDDEGIRPEALESALRREPVALYLQPRAQNPTGVTMSPARAARLADILRRHPGVLVVEDDHAGDIATAAPVSLGTHLPEQTMHVHSFAKSHGPDLRLAAIGGPGALVAAIADRRLLGPGWSSRLLQAVLLDLLTDPASLAQLDVARAEYARRRSAALAALAAHGVRASAADGINLWLEVADQQVAMLSLAAHGIAVAPGAPFAVTTPPVEHIRVTIGLVQQGFAELSAILAQAATATARVTGRRPALPRGGR